VTSACCVAAFIVPTWRRSSPSAGASPARLVPPGRAIDGTVTATRSLCSTGADFPAPARSSIRSTGGT